MTKFFSSNALYISTNGTGEMVIEYNDAEGETQTFAEDHRVTLMETRGDIVFSSNGVSTTVYGNHQFDRELDPIFFVRHEWSILIADTPKRLKALINRYCPGCVSEYEL